jgi:hypothetical protein
MLNKINSALLARVAEDDKFLPSESAEGKAAELGVDEVSFYKLTQNGLLTIGEADGEFYYVCSDDGLAELEEYQRSTDTVKIAKNANTLSIIAIAASFSAVVVAVISIILKVS